MIPMLMSTCSSSTVNELRQKCQVHIEEKLGEISASLEYYGHLAQEARFQVGFSVNGHFYKGDGQECVCKWEHSQHLLWSSQVLSSDDSTDLPGIQVVCLGSLAICSTLCDHILHENCQTSSSRTYLDLLNVDNLFTLTSQLNTNLLPTSHHHFTLPQKLINWG